jgi:hypothetical protein
MQRPAGVTFIAGVFLLAATHLALSGLTMLVHPGLISMAAGAALLGGLELAGPYAFLLAGALGALIGFGLLRLNNWARRVAALVSIAGVVMLVPDVSGAVISVHASGIIWGGLGVIVRVMIAWYLYQEPVAEVFMK